MILALLLALAAQDPIGVVEGQPAPYTGILVAPDRAGELVEAEARAADLEARLAQQEALTLAWKERATVDWWESPEANRWAGFAAGIGVAVGAIILGAWISDIAATPPGGS